jgi:hypothetical protein
MKLLDDYLKLQQEIYDYFGYKEDWRVIPIEDSRNSFWKLDEYGDEVFFADTLKELKEEGGNYYGNEIIHDGVYRGKEYTLIEVDTHTDGNKFLQIFSNDKLVSKE